MQDNSFFKKITYTDGIYPNFSIGLIENPSRFYAIPLIGFLVKLIGLIPVAIVVFFIALWYLIAVMIINPFVVLSTGKYWVPAYQVALTLMKMSVKMSTYMFGLTDKYPGFNSDLPPGMTLDIPMPENPSKLYAIPLIGILVRSLIMIPYFVFTQIISRAAGLGVCFIASLSVLFTGKYPESIYELTRDSIRTGMSSYAYTAGLSDRYPSFYISMKHDKIKLILIGISIVLLWFSFSANKNQPNPYLRNYNPVPVTNIP